MRIAVFVGSLHKESINKKLAKKIEEMTPENMTFDYVDISSLPLYSQDLEASFPEQAANMKDTVKSADAVLFVTPEYNRSIPGPLKNALDWLSRPWGDNSIDKKPAAVIGASASSLGTALSQTQLRDVLIYLNARIMGQPEVYIANAANLFDHDGKNLDQKTLDRLQAFVDEFMDYIGLLTIASKS